jgi:hypothetical protein
MGIIRINTARKTVRKWQENLERIEMKAAVLTKAKAQ